MLLDASIALGSCKLLTHTQKIDMSGDIDMALGTYVSIRAKAMP